MKYFRARTLVAFAVLTTNLPAGEEPSLKPSLASWLPEMPILCDPIFQPEMQLSQAQRKAVQELDREWAQAVEQFPEADPKLDARSRRKRAAAVAAPFRERMWGILNAEQDEKLREFQRLSWAGPASQTHLLRNPMRTEVGLTQDQRRAVEDLDKLWLKHVFAQVHGLSRKRKPGQGPWMAPFNQETERVAREFRPDLRRRLEEILSVQQYQRWRQVLLQESIFSRGPWVFLRALPHEVTTHELKLTATQREQIEQICREWDKQVRERRRPRDSKGGQWLLESMKHREAAIGRVLELLTGEQQRRWDKLLGQPVRWERYLPWLKPGTQQEPQSETSRENLDPELCLPCVTESETPCCGLGLLMVVGVPGCSSRTDTPSEDEKVP